jgi:hypothetical protein
MRRSNVKFKTPLLTILSLAILTRAGYAQTPPELQKAQSSAYGIEPTGLYPGTLVLELMDAAEAEIDAAVNEAFAEGYKAAALRFAPDAAMFKNEAEALRRELEAERKKCRYFWPAVGASVIVSFTGGFLLCFFAGR